MSIGSKGHDSVFGVPEKTERQASLSVDPAAAPPLPSDLAQSERLGHRASPLPSEDARGGGRPGRRIGRLGGGRSDGSRDKRTDDAGAFESAVDTPDLLVDDNRARRRKLAVVAAVLVVLSLVSLFVDAGFACLFDPREVFTCYGIWIQQAIASVSSPLDATPVRDIVFEHQAYFRILNRVGITVMTAICGAVLAIAGSLYQSAFRNPIAGPSMLGVSSAIQLGDVILVMIFGASAGLMLGYRYLICYTCVIVVMVLLFTFARLMTGRGRPLNVVNLLLVAMIITQLIGVVVTYITTFVLDWELWQVYNNLSEALNVNLDMLSWIVFLVSCAVGLVPVIVLRFRLNGLNFGDVEMKLLGINAGRLRLAALICGTVMLMAAQVQMGTIAMLSLVVPHVSRMVFGAEFRKQLGGCVLIGSALLMLCRIVIGLIPDIGPYLPIGVVLNFLVLPFFVWMLATQQRGWEQ